MANDECVLGIGTMLDVDGNKHMVSGYRLIEDKGMVGLAYVMLPYPLGYVSADDLTLIASDLSLPVVASGYAEDSQKELLTMLANARKEGARTLFSDYCEAMKSVYGETGGELDG